MPYFYYFLAWFFILFSHIVIAPQISIDGIYPDVILIAAVLIGMKQGWTRGLWFGFAFGLSIDLMDPQNYGLTTLMISLAGYFGGMIREKIFLDNMIHQSLSVFVFSFVYHIVFPVFVWPRYFADNIIDSIADSVFISLYSLLVSLSILFILSQRSRLKELL